METPNVNGQNLNDLKAMFANFQKKQTQSTSTSREDKLAKYFVPRKTKEIFRILPPKHGKKHIEEAFFHVVPTNASGGKIKHGSIIYCPAHNDPKVPKLDANGNTMLDTNGNPVMIPAPCPLCAKHKKLIATQDPSLKGKKKDDMNPSELKIKAKNDEIYKEAIKWEAKKFYIVRGIDKGMEKDGVKFWRFKHNYKNQGTLDKLLPILQEYMETQLSDFSDPNVGTDLSIIMTDTELNGRVYKTISAITYRGKSILHGDQIVMNEWLNDNVTWRDVFKPKTAPNITPYEFLEMIAIGNSPYWDDTDQSKKHWVFPGRPDLEEAANNRQRNLDADTDDNFEMASDVETHANRIINSGSVNINNVNKTNVGTFEDNSINLGKKTVQETAPDDIDSNIDDIDTDYDDLPF